MRAGVGKALLLLAVIGVGISSAPARAACVDANGVVESNAVCTGNKAPYNCCTGPGTGSCPTEQCDGTPCCVMSGAAAGRCLFAATGSSCGSAGDTVCDNPDTCNGAGTCLANHEPTSVVCRADAGQCDVAETCDGAGSCPADGFEPAGTSCGSPSDTSCDNPDTCNGGGVCLTNNEPDTVVCRPEVGECDVAETCDGAGSCPADTFAAAGTGCGDPSDTACDNPDTCNASGACLDNHEPDTVVCLPDAGECDVADYCDGAGSCPADTFAAAGTGCGDPSDTACDNPDTCDGSGSCLDNHEPDTVVCLPDAGECDVADYCDGAGSCPADTFAAPGASCGDPSDSACDNPDTCDGSGACLDNHEPDTVVCLPEAGECDVADYCDGAGSCPADTFAAAGTGCGESTDTLCDDPDTCDGSGTCLPNFEPADVVCRGDAGQCDVAETCDGAGSCPEDAFAPAGTSCGSPSDTSCDDPDTCDGDGNCLLNHAPDTTLCRGDAGDCDIAEYCDGAGLCPEDAFEPSVTPCGDATDTECTDPDHCSGTSAACLPADAPAETACGDAETECVHADACDGAGTCSDNGFKDAGTSCGSSSDTDCDDPDTCDGGGSCAPNFEPDTATCGDAEAECVNQDYCDGAGLCADNGFKPAETSCGDATDTECTDPDHCSGTSAACLPADAPAETACGDAETECVHADACDGAGTCSDNGFKDAGTSCGSSSDSVCDHPDSCDGGGSCVANLEPDTTVCRADAGACDVAETCASGVCPEDAFEPADTACGSPSDSVCDDPDTCDGDGNCQLNHEPDTTLCRDDAGDCDMAEYCDGAGSCPGNSFEPADTPCGSASDTICDAADTCDGGGNCEPNSEPDGTLCRDDAGECDVAETCLSGACPPDGFEPSGTSCGDSSSSQCDSADTCDGDGDCAQNHQPDGTLCRDDAGECDIEETCVAGLCPDDAFEPADTACGDPTGTPCDSPDACDGSGECAANQQPDGTLCRDDAGECDIAETCVAGLCPDDAFEPADTACGDPTATPCDGADACDGSGACAANLQPDGTLCRGDAGECDVEETCVAGLCPDDAFEPSGTACGSGDDSDCDDPDSCDETGSCLPNHEPDATFCDDGLYCNGADACSSGLCTASNVDPCPGPDGDGNCSESCNETDDDCTADDPTGSACDDSLFCTQAETCRSGTCGGGSPTDCGDGDLCTQDSCNEEDGCVNALEPVDPAGCFLPNRSYLVVRDTGFLARNVIKWGWRRGEPTSPATLGDPETTTSWALCLYDHTEGAPELVGSYDVPPGSHWTVDGERARYGDPAGSSDGVKRLRGRTSMRMGKSRWGLRASGQNLELPERLNGLEFFDVDAALTVQLLNDEGMCWSTDFTPAHVQRNTASRFRALEP